MRAVVDIEDEGSDEVGEEGEEEQVANEILFLVHVPPPTLRHLFDVLEEGGGGEGRERGEGKGGEGDGRERERRRRCVILLVLVLTCSRISRISLLDSVF